MSRLLLPLLLLLALPSCAAEDPSADEAAEVPLAEVPAASADDVVAPVDPSMVAGNTAAADQGPSPVLEAVLIDVGTAAPRLESFYRGEPYPQALEEVLATLEPAGVVLAPGNQVAGYAYDPEAVEFELCVEHIGTGAWATYDTAPMSLREQGESGGCPD